MTGPAAYLYYGCVAHRRLRPVEHRFAYRVFSMLIDVDRIDEAAANLKLFSRNRFNLFSFNDGDHADDRNAPLAAQIRAMLWGAGFRGDGRILLLCYPRILGYVFNPLSVFYCYDGEGVLEAILYEVRNTFGEKHNYLIAVEDGAGRIRQFAEKKFHVSPFMAMDQRYEFDLSEPHDSLSIGIRQFDAEGPLFTASFSGRGKEMTDATLIGAFFRYPLMTVKVIVAIHCEAARLFAKGVRLSKRPPSPVSPVSVVARKTSRRRVA